MKMELKEAKIKNGKICLEGRVVDVDLLDLKIITFPSFRRKEIEDCIAADYNKPEGANAYVRGEPILSGPSDNGIFGSPVDYHPVLYLKIKEEK